MWAQYLQSLVIAMIFLCWASSSLSGHRYTSSGHPVQILHGAVTSRYKHQKILLQELNRILVVDALDVLAKIGAMDDKLKGSVSTIKGNGLLPNHLSGYVTRLDWIKLDEYPILTHFLV